MRGGFVLVTGALPLWLVILFVWLARLVATMLVRCRSRQDDPGLLAGWPHWFVVPLFCGLTYFAVTNGWPARLAFQISRPALDRLAQEAMATRQPREHCWAGVLPFSRVTPDREGVQFKYARKEVPWGQRGLHYSIADEFSTRSYYYSQSKLGGGWYTWHYGGW